MFFFLFLGVVIQQLRFGSKIILLPKLFLIQKLIIFQLDRFEVYPSQLIQMILYLLDQLDKKRLEMLQMYLKT